MLITEEMRALNAQLHRDKEHYGTSGGDHAERIRALASKIGATSILDYGCGKRSLERALGYSIANYDPAIPGLDGPPEPAELVACTDVLEHIEPELLDAVLDDLKRVTERCLFATVCTVPAMKHLADGRNAHLIVQPARWWLPKLMERFDLFDFESIGYSFVVVMMRRQDTA